MIFKIISFNKKKDRNISYKLKTYSKSLNKNNDINDISNIDNIVNNLKNTQSILNNNNSNNKYDKNVSYKKDSNIKHVKKFGRIFFLKNKSKIIIYFLILLLLLFFSNEYTNSIKYTINIFINNIIPSLFPFLILSEFAIYTNVFESIANILKNFIYKLFKVSKYSTVAIIIGFLLGYPSGAKTVNKLYLSGLINKHDVNILMAFINNANPAFIISSIGIIIYNNISIGVILLLSHYISSFLIGFFYSRYYSQKYIINNYTKNFNNSLRKNLGILRNNTNESYIHNKKNKNILSVCIINASYTLVMIFGFMCIFNIIYDLLINLLEYLNISFNYLKLIISLLEITKASYFISTINNFSYINIILQSVIIGFSGFCIIFQIYSSIYNTNFKLKNIIFFKAIHGILSGIITYILLMYTNILNFSNQTTLNNFSKNISENYNTQLNFKNNLIYVFLYLLTIIALFILFKILLNKISSYQKGNYKKKGVQH